MRSLVGLLAASLMIAGCSAGAVEHVRGTSSPSVRDVLSAALSVPSAKTVVVGGSTPQALSVAASRRLFRTAPVVVVAAGGRLTAPGAPSWARRLGVPMLIDDRVDGADLRGEMLRREIQRLRAKTVLAVGAGVAADLRRMHVSGVVTDPADLPPVSAPRAMSGLAVLVHAGGGAAVRSGTAAVTATALAAGARVVAVHGDDPRADPAAIAALAAARPSWVLAAGQSFGPAGRLAARVAVAVAGQQLPGGGQVMFPGRRLVALYGHPGTSSLGVLGAQGLEASIARAKKVAAAYDRLGDVPVVPTFEIIATTAQGTPGSDGDYSAESSVASLRPWVTKAGAAGMYVVLDLQPGRADLLRQAQAYRSLLRLPYVGLAIDPEWALAPGERPLEQIGSVSAADINRVSAWLARLTASQHLPQKLLVLHQFLLSMIGDEQDLDTSHDDLALLVHMDGQGSPGAKEATWGAVKQVLPAGVWLGWKNFYKNDKPMLTPTQTMAEHPKPVMISYQ